MTAAADSKAAELKLQVLNALAGWGCDLLTTWEGRSWRVGYEKDPTGSSSRTAMRCHRRPSQEAARVRNDRDPVASLKAAKNTRSSKAMRSTCTMHDNLNLTIFSTIIIKIKSGLVILSRRISGDQSFTVPLTLLGAEPCSAPAWPAS